MTKTKSTVTLSVFSIQLIYCPIISITLFFKNLENIALETS